MVRVDDEGPRYRRRGRPGSTLAVSTLTVDLLGCEEVDPGRAAAFLALGVDLIDMDHPPPPDMLVQAASQPAIPTKGAPRTWPLAASTTTAVPFRLRLPLDTGPPPFSSKHARIHFLLAATATLREDEKAAPGSGPAPRHRHERVRTTRPDLQVLPTYDPERALAPPLRPLTASDEVRRRGGSSSSSTGPCERVTLTAGLLRPVWLAGASLFVDVHIANAAAQPVRRVYLSLERNVLCYDHAAAALDVSSPLFADHHAAAGPFLGDGTSPLRSTTTTTTTTTSRIFTRNERTVVARVVLGSSSGGGRGRGHPHRPRLGAGLLGWKPRGAAALDADADVLVAPHTAATRTCELAVPRGHTTVAGGKYVEVRYVLTVRVGGGNSGSGGGGGGRGGTQRRTLGPVTVRLPVVLVHVNSLDVVPNAVPQVAAAMEERRRRREEEEEGKKKKEGVLERIERAANTASSSRNGPLRTREGSQWETTDDGPGSNALPLRRKPSQYAPGRAFAAPREQSCERRCVVLDGEGGEVRRSSLESGRLKMSEQREDLNQRPVRIAQPAPKEDATVAAVPSRTLKPGRWSPLSPRWLTGGDAERGGGKREKRSAAAAAAGGGDDGSSSRANTPNSLFAIMPHRPAPHSRSHPIRQPSSAASSQVPLAQPPPRRRPSRSRTATDATSQFPDSAPSSSPPPSPALPSLATRIPGLLRPAGFFRSDPSLKSKSSVLRMRTTRRAVAGSHGGMHGASGAVEILPVDADPVAWTSRRRRLSVEGHGDEWMRLDRSRSVSRGGGTGGGGGGGGGGGDASRAPSSSATRRRRRSTSTATTHVSHRDLKQQQHTPYPNLHAPTPLTLAPHLLGLPTTTINRPKPRPPSPAAASSSRRVSFDRDPVRKIIPSLASFSSSSPRPLPSVAAASTTPADPTTGAAPWSLHEQQRERRRFEISAPPSRNRKPRTTKSAGVTVRRPRPWERSGAADGSGKVGGKEDPIGKEDGSEGGSFRGRFGGVVLRRREREREKRELYQRAEEEEKKRSLLQREQGLLRQHLYWQRREEAERRPELQLQQYGVGPARPGWI